MASQNIRAELEKKAGDLNRQMGIIHQRIQDKKEQLQFGIQESLQLQSHAAELTREAGEEALGWQKEYEKQTSQKTFQQFKEGDVGHFFSVVFTIYHAGIACVATAIIALSSFIASLMLQRGFYSAWPLIPILIMAFYFNILNTFYGTVFTAALRTKPLFTTTVFGAVGCAVFTVALIPFFDIYGAAIAMALSNAVVLALRVRAARKVLVFFVNWPVVLVTMTLLCVQALVMVNFNPGGMPIVALLALICVAIQVWCTSPYWRRVLPSR